MVMELFVQLLNQTPLPTEQTLWARFSVCFSGLTVESATIFKKKKKQKTCKHQKNPQQKNPHTLSIQQATTQGFNKAS